MPSHLLRQLCGGIEDVGLFCPSTLPFLVYSIFPLCPRLQGDFLLHKGEQAVGITRVEKDLNLLSWAFIQERKSQQLLSGLIYLFGLGQRKLKKYQYLTKGHGLTMTGSDQSVFTHQGQDTLLSQKKKKKKKIGVCILPRKKWEKGLEVGANCACH